MRVYTKVTGDFPEETSQRTVSIPREQGSNVLPRERPAQGLEEVTKA